MQYLNMFLTFVNSNVKSVKMFGYIKKMYYFCGVKMYKKKRGHHNLSQLHLFKPL